MKYKNIALVFPGQGSQYVGMGKEFHDQFSFVREIYDRASGILGYDLAEQCFKKPHIGKKIMHRGDLNKTVYTQPAVLITGYACYRVLADTLKKREMEISFPLMAGHSLGEYTALLVSGAIPFKECLELVKKRAVFMTESGKAYPGAGLMAIVDKKKGLDYDKVCSLCKEFELYIALNNTLKQIVVGGAKKNLTELSKELKKERKIGTILKVEGPFHTPIMRPAARKLRKELNRTPFRIGRVPVIANVSTDAVVDPNHIKKDLYEQMYKVVNWRGSVEKMVRNGCDLFIEVGPKKVLRNMIRDIDPSIPSLNVEDMESLEKTVRELAG